MRTVASFVALSLLLAGCSTGVLGPCPNGFTDPPFCSSMTEPQNH